MPELNKTDFLRNVRQAVETNRLNKAIAMLSEEAVELKSSVCLDMLREAKETYSYLFQYFSEGFADDSREKVYMGIQDNLLLIADYLDCVRKSSDSTDIYFCTLRNHKFSRTDLKENIDDYLNICDVIAAGNVSTPDLNIKRDRLLQDIFDMVWTAFPLSSDIHNILLELISSDTTPKQLSSQIISALLLGTLKYYDPRKLTLVLQSLNRVSDNELQARLSVVLFIILSSHSSRAGLSSDAQLILKTLYDDPDFAARITNVYFNFIKACDTDRVNNKMKNDLMPDLKKIQDLFDKKIGKDAYSIEDISLSAGDINPEWEDILEKSGMLDKIRELQDLQTDGADVFMLPFSNLKHFPFFRKVSNWFLPFDSSNSEFMKMDGAVSKVIKPLVSLNSGMCNSDLYSMALSVQSMPETHINSMSSQIESQLGQLSEMGELSDHDNKMAQVDNAILCYMRDIYRFFKLFNRNTEFIDPFIIKPASINLPFINDLLTDEDTLRTSAEFYFKIGDHDAALSLFEKLIPISKDKFQLYQKAGYSAHSIGYYDRALVFYTAAEDYAQDNLWLLKKIAACYRRIGELKKAIEYFKRALELDRDHIGLNLNLANAMLAVGDVESALRIYYKVDFLDETRSRAVRPIAWCEFLSGRYDKSRNYYEKIMFDSPGYSDLMNIGHLSLCERKIKEAVRYYKESLSEFGGHKDQWLKEFDEDRDLILGKSGLSDIEIDILIDGIL